jgi:hypothetical protein
MKRILYTLLLLLSTIAFSQSKGITYQAVIYIPGGQNIPGVDIIHSPMVNRKICLKFSFIDSSSNLEYEEVVKTTTDEFGMVNLLIGSNDQTGGYASSFDAITWNTTEKILKVALDVSATCATFEEISSAPLTSVPFAYASATADHISGVVSVTHGGTGAITAAGARTNLGLGNIDNTSDANKPISIATQTALNGKENTANKSLDIVFDGASDVKFPSVKAVKTYVDNHVASVSANIVDADVTTKGKIQLAGDLSGTAALPTVPGLALKENTSNKSLNVTTDATSDVKYPSVRAVKTYVDTAIIGATIVDADATTKGKIQLAGDLSGSAALPTIAINAITTTKVADNAITDAKITAVSGNKITGNIAGNAANVTGVIAIANGGTGATTAAAARTNLGLGSAATSNTTDFEVPVTVSSPLVRTVNSIAIPVATATVNGYLNTTDFNTFSNKIGSAEKAANNGVATLGNDGKIPSSQIPAISFQSANVVTSQTAMLAIAAAQVGSIAIRTDINKNYVLSALPATTLSNWLELSTPTAVTSVNGNAGPNVNLTKSDIVLGNVDNTSDINKPISTATQAALDLKANLASPTFTGTVSGITKSMVGLGNVDNTTDANKPVSTATQTALDLKANATDVTTSLALKEDAANKTIDVSADGTSDVKFPSAKAVKTYADAKVVDGITDAVITSAPTQNAVFDALALKANLASPTFTGTVSGITKSMVGLGNVDNTADVNKPVSTATQTALDLKVNTATVTSALALKEDVANKSTDSSLGSTNPSDVLYPSQKAIKTYVDLQSANAGVADGSITSAKILDGTLVTADLADGSVTPAKLSGIVPIAKGGTNASTVVGAKTNLGLENVDNTSDASKPVSTATQTALDLKANTATVTSSLALKEDAANKTIDVSADGTSDVKFPSAKAVKTYADAKVVDGITDAVTTSAPTQNAVFDALALKANLASPTFTGTVSGITKSMVGLGNVDNTSDASKPVSTATQTALDLKANTATVTSSLALKEDAANKTIDVSADGTSDVKFPSAKAVKTYTDAKVVDGITDAVTTSAPTQNAVFDALALKANLASPTFTGTVSGITKSMVGLGNVDNTTDANKPVSTATQTALDLKANATDVTTSLALKEDAANKTIDVSADGTSDVKFPSAKAVKTYTDAKVVDGITDAVTTSAPTQNAVFDALALKANLASPTFTGTVSGITKSMVGLGNVDNTTDANKPVSTATQTALDLKANATDVTTSLALKEDAANKTIDVSADGTSDVKFPSAKAVKTYTDAKVVDGITDAVTTSAPTQNAVFDALALKANLASPTFTGTVSGITKSMVGLGNVDNTTDANKPVSTATQTALDLKADASTVTSALALKEDAANKSTTTSLGTSDVLFPTQNAVKTYVDAQITSVTVTDADSTTKGKIKLAGDLSGTAAIPQIATDAVTSAKIKDGEIVDVDVAANAAIAFSKLAIAKSDIVGLGIPTADTNTTYSAGTGVTLTGTTFSIGQDVAPSATPTFAKVNKVTITAPTTGATLTIADGKTLTVNDNATISGSNTGDQTTITGNAGTATKLATARNINGVAFDGSADITVTAAAGTLTGTTLASNVVSSSLTSVGTLTNLTVTNPIVGSVTGNAATVTTNANLTGDVTSSGNATSVVKINGTSLAGLATGILKNTTTTGVPSIAVAADFPTLNQSTTGTAANVTGIVGIANGGTGATTKTLAFDALSPMTASGDIIYGGASGTGTRLAKGTDGQVLTLASGAPTWAVAPGISSIGAISGTSTANGGSITAGVLNLAPADGTNGGIVTAGTQTIGGAKIFTSTQSTSGGSSGAPVVKKGIALNPTFTTTGSYTEFVGLDIIPTFNLGGYDNSSNTIGLRVQGANIVATGKGNDPSNTAIGTNALNANTGTSSGSNVAIGMNALLNNTTGTNNTAIGVSTLSNGSSGSSNTAIGNSALRLNSSSNNVAVGSGALDQASGLSNSIAIGQGAAHYYGPTNMNAYSGSSGSYNVFIGSDVRPLTNTDSNEIIIGSASGVVGKGTNTTSIGSPSTISTRLYGATLYNGDTTAAQYNAAVDMTLKAQDANVIGYSGGANNAGGNIILTPGASTGVASKGIVTLNSAINIVAGTAAASVNGMNSVITAENGGAGNQNGGNIVLTPGTATGTGTTGIVQVSGQLKVTGGTPGVGKVLTSDANGLASWSSSSGGGISALANIGSTPNANGATISGSNLNLEPASASYGGVVTTTAQTFAGAKTFNSDIKVNGVPFGIGSATAGKENIAIGGSSPALGHATSTASDNIGLGTGALNATSLSGTNNIGIGSWALTSKTSGGYNLGMGSYSLYSSTTGSNNVAVGAMALYGNTTTSGNTAIGMSALKLNTGDYNSAVGYGSINNNTGGSYNVAFGYNSLYSSGSASNNVALGANSLTSLSESPNNVAIGYNAGINVTTDGSNKGSNIMIGYDAGARYGSGATGSFNSTGYNNILIGRDVRPSADGDNNEIVISGYNTTSSLGGTGNGSHSTTIGNALTQKSQVYGALKVVPNTAATSTDGNSSIIAAQTAGTGATNAGGSVTIAAGNGNSTGLGGNIVLTPGTSTTAANNGIVQVNGQVKITGGTPGVGKVLTSDANGLASWSSASGSGVTTVAAIGSSDNASGATISGSTLTLQPASVNNGGVVTNGTQSFAGAKTFASDLHIGSLTVGRGGSLIASNAAFGESTLAANTSGSYNTAMGNLAMSNSTSTDNNVAIGYSSLYSKTTGGNNTSIGANAQYYSTTGYSNTSLGSSSLYKNTIGTDNIAIGAQSLYNLNHATDATKVARNISMGNLSLNSMVTGVDNVGIGFDAGYLITSGDNNVMIGRHAGGGDNSLNQITNLSNSVMLGFNTMPAASGETNETVIGYGAVGLGSNTTVLGNADVTDTRINGKVNIPNATTASSTTYAALTVSGGVGIAKDTYMGGTAKILSTSGSANVTSGALVVSGGVGIAKDTYIGGVINAIPSSSQVMGLPGSSATIAAQNASAGGSGYSGGAVNLISGNGSSSGSGANGGNINLTTGNSGTTSGTAGGDVVMTLGTGPTTQYNGSLYLNTNSNPISGNSKPTLGIVTPSGQDAISVKSNANGNNVLNLWQLGSNSANAVAFYKGDTQNLVGTINVTSSSTSYNTTSDYRLKTDFKDFNGAKLLDSIKVYDYQWKLDNSRSYGVKAHELQEIIPYAVTGEKDAVNSDGSIHPQSVDYSKLVPVLIKALQEQEAQVKDSQTVNTQLKEQLELLKVQLDLQKIRLERMEKLLEKQ